MTGKANIKSLYYTYIRLPKHFPGLQARFGAPIINRVFTWALFKKTIGSLGTARIKTRVFPGPGLGNGPGPGPKGQLTALIPGIIPREALLDFPGKTPGLGHWGIPGMVLGLGPETNKARGPENSLRGVPRANLDSSNPWKPIYFIRDS